MHLKSEGGEIGVYLCPEIDELQNTSPEPGTSQSQQSKQNPATPSSSSSVDELIKSEDIDGLFSSKLERGMLHTRWFISIIHPFNYLTHLLTVVFFLGVLSPDGGFSMLDLDDAEFQFALGADEGIVNLFGDGD